MKIGYQLIDQLNVGLVIHKVGTHMIEQLVNSGAKITPPRRPERRYILTHLKYIHLAHSLNIEYIDLHFVRSKDLKKYTKGNQFRVCYSCWTIL